MGDASFHCNCLGLAFNQHDVLVRAKADTETAATYPEIVAGVGVFTRINGQGNTVEEHVTAKRFVRILRQILANLEEQSSSNFRTAY